MITVSYNYTLWGLYCALHDKADAGRFEMTRNHPG